MRRDHRVQKNLQRLADDLVGFLPLDIDDESHAAGVVFELRVWNNPVSPAVLSKDCARSVFHCCTAHRLAASLSTQYNK